MMYGFQALGCIRETAVAGSWRVCKVGFGTTRLKMVLASLLMAGAAGASAETSFPTAFDAGAVYGHEIFVNASASPGGDGSPGAPFRAIAAALAQAKPGTRIRVAPGTYGPVGSVTNLQGKPGAPIALTGDNGAVIDGGGRGAALHLVDPRYVIIERMAIRNAFPHGINIDDGGSYATPASHVLLRNVAFSQIGNGGNNDCLKLSGVDDFRIENSRFTGCNRGEGIDMVGCHRGLIAGNTFSDMPGTAVQAKGGSSDVLIHGNRFTRIGERAINAGGSTGAPWFRPLDARREAERIRAVANVIEATGSAPIVFAGCGDCVFANNTVIDPGDFVARIVEENATRQPGRGGLFINNIVILNSRRARATVDVRKGTEPATYTFGWNLWYARNAPSFAGPLTAPGIPSEQHPVFGRDPMLDPALRPRPGSPALAAGRPLPGLAVVDFDGRPYGNPPAIGAFAGP